MAEKNKKDQTGESGAGPVPNPPGAPGQAGRPPGGRGRTPSSRPSLRFPPTPRDQRPLRGDGGPAVTIAGRLMSKRGMGKVSFCDLQDKSGRIQLYARKDEMDEAEYDLLQEVRHR